MARETLNPFEIAQKQVKSACDKLNADPAVYEILKNPMRVLEVSFPVRLDDGTVKTFIGYRSQHNNAVGPFKGGLRFHPDVTKDESKSIVYLDDIQMFSSRNPLWWWKRWNGN